MVVPDVSWCTYPGKEPDIIIDIDISHRDYFITFPSLKDHFDDDEDISKILKDMVKEANVLEHEDCQIRIQDNKIYVPFTDIIVHLMWADLQKVTAIKNGTISDPIFESMINKVISNYS